MLYILLYAFLLYILQVALQVGKEDGEVPRSPRKVRQKRKVGDLIKDADSRGKFTMGK